MCVTSRETAAYRKVRGEGVFGAGTKGGEGWRSLQGSDGRNLNAMPLCNMSGSQDVRK